MNTLIRIFASAAIAILLLPQFSIARGSGAFTSEKAVRLAKAQLAQRHLPLPPRFDVKVIKSVQYSEIHADRSIYIVSFRQTAGPRKSARLFDVNIDRATGKVLYVNDLRRNVPAP